MFRIDISKLFKWLFSRVLASHCGGPDSILGQDMSVLGPHFRMEMTLVKSLHIGDPDVIQNTRTCKASARQQSICLA